MIATVEQSGQVLAPVENRGYFYGELRAIVDFEPAGCAGYDAARAELRRWLAVVEQAGERAELRNSAKNRDWVSPKPSPQGTRYANQA